MWETYISTERQICIYLGTLNNLKYRCEISPEFILNKP